MGNQETTGTQQPSNQSIIKVMFGVMQLQTTYIASPTAMPFARTMSVGRLLLRPTHTTSRSSNSSSGSILDTIHTISLSIQPVERHAAATNVPMNHSTQGITQGNAVCKNSKSWEAIQFKVCSRHTPCGCSPAEEASKPPAIAAAQTHPHHLQQQHLQQYHCLHPAYCFYPRHYCCCCCTRRVHALLPVAPLHTPVAAARGWQAAEGTADGPWGQLQQQRQQLQQQ